MHSKTMALLMGLAFSLHFSAVWSCVVFLIKPKALGFLISIGFTKRLGKAYGLIIAL